MIKTACRRCGRFSEQVTAGGCCPHCGNRDTLGDKIAPIVFGVVVVLGIVAFFRLLLVP